MQQKSVYYSASSLYVFRVSTTPIIRNTQNCNYSFRYWSYFLCSCLPPTWLLWPLWREVTAQYRRLQLQFCVLLMMGVLITVQAINFFIARVSQDRKIVLGIPAWKMCCESMAYCSPYGKLTWQELYRN